MTNTLSTDSSNRFYSRLFILLALLAAFAFQGSRGLYETTEGRYAEVAREMFETGSYLEPTLGYKPHWTKPPLTYWAIVAGMKALGQNEWGVRLYLSIAFVLTAVVVSLIARAIWGETAGVIAGFIYISSPFPMLGASAVSTDALLTLWELAAVLCYLKAVQEDAGTGKFRWILAMWLMWALAFLTKGPPGLLPLLPIMVWHSRNGRKAPLFHPVGLILFLVVGLSWYVVECLRHPELFSYFLGRELLQRAVFEEDRNPQWYKPFKFYLPALAAGGGAWSYYGWRLFRERGLLDPWRLWAEIRRPGIGSFLLLWLLIPLTIFFIVKSRLFLYVLPLYAPVAIAAAGYIFRRRVDAGTLKRVAVVASVSVGLLVAGKAFAGYYPSYHDMRFAAELFRRGGVKGGVCVLVDDPSGYSVDFYIRQRVERTHTTRGDGRRSVERILRKAQKKPKSDTYAFLVRADEADDLGEKIEKANLPFTTTKNEHWSLYVVRPAERATKVVPQTP